MSDLMPYLLAVIEELKKSNRDTIVFDNLKQAVHAKGDTAITEIQDFIQQHSGKASASKSATFVSIDMSPAHAQIAGCIALVHVGETAKNVLYETILAEPFPAVRHEMLKEIVVLEEMWLVDILVNLSNLESDKFTQSTAQMYLRDNRFYNQVVSQRLKPPLPDVLSQDAGQRQALFAHIEKNAPIDLLPDMISWLDVPMLQLDVLKVLTRVYAYRDSIRQNREQHQQVMEKTAAILEAAVDTSVCNAAVRFIARIATSSADLTPVVDYCLTKIEDTTLADDVRQAQISTLGSIIQDSPIKHALLQTLLTKLENIYDTEPALQVAIQDALRKKRIDMTLRDEKCSVCSAEFSLDALLGRCPNCNKVFCKEHLQYSRPYCSEKCYVEHQTKLTGTTNPRYW